MNKLGDLIRERYSDRQLSDAQLVLLQSKQKRSFFASRKPLFIGAAASILLMLSAWLFVSTFNIVQPVSVYSLASETVSNHIKAKALEIQSSNDENLQTFFSKLPFKLLPMSQVLDMGQWEVLGGRYCSLNGEKGAQVRIRNKQTGVIETFYQVRYHNTSLERIALNQAQTIPTKHGAYVKIWVHNGILLTQTDAHASSIFY